MRSIKETWELLMFLGQPLHLVKLNAGFLFLAMNGNHLRVMAAKWQIKRQGCWWILTVDRGRKIITTVGASEVTLEDT